MQRVKINIPEKIDFSCQLQVTINSINYGNHLGNDAFFAFAHEARIQWLKSLGYTELNIEGLGIIMLDASIQYLSQVFHAEMLTINISVVETFNNGFNLVYLFTKINETAAKKVALIQSNMLFYNYETQKIAEMPIVFAKKMEQTATNS